VDGKKVRVLVVDDSALMRRVIWGLLEEDPDIVVVGSAVDGRDAVAKVQQLKPDVVTLDVEMPKMDGLQTLGYLMNENPVPCVMLSAYTPRGAETTLKALDYGATDFVQKPSGVVSLNLERVKEELLDKVKVAATIDLKRLPFRPGTGLPGAAGAAGPALAGAAHSAPGLAPPPARVKERPKTDRGCVVAIGTSTGGPRALGAVLPGLPGGLPAPVVVVQHMSAGFTKSLAERLDRECALRVKEAEADEVLEAGTVYLAPGDWHMSLERRAGKVRVKLDQRPPILGVRPCVDVLFQSVAEVYGPKAVGVVLTGMGRDGAKGLKAMKAAQARVIAQDEATSVVYGMPRAAFASGCVDRVLPLDAVAANIVEMLP
jgi:two-component system chemotaxis response regulator CheB